MDSPMGTPMEGPRETPRDMRGGSSMLRAEAHMAAGDLAKWWWVWLVVGILWILASIVILQFRTSSVTIVGIIIGVMFLVAGVQEFLIAYVTEGWRWLWITFGVILVIGGIYALFNPTRTFLVVADMLGFLFVLVGIFWVVEAFATMSDNPLWGLGLASGIIMIVLGFWAAGQLYTTQAYVLLIFAGIWALLHGISDIINAFMIKRAGDMLAAA